MRVKGPSSEALELAGGRTASHLFWYPGHELLLPDIVRAENCHLHDDAGKRYLDLESGVWCASIGHGHPRVLRALVEQAARIAHAGFAYTSPVVEETARDVLSLLGFEGGRCVFLCSGSDAVEYGVRVAQAVLDRPLLLTMTDSYFGAYGSAARKRESEWFCFDWTRCAGGCGERCPHWAEIPFDGIGGFLFEPGSSSGLVRFPPRGLIEAIVRSVTERDGLILVNEVTTGIGRTGEWFGHQHYGLTPDIVAMGKGIGAGYPVSATAFAPRVAERCGEPIKFAQSHQNDPLGAAVVREVLRVIREERLIERGREAGAALLAGLEAIRSRTRGIRQVRGRGLMVALELEDDRELTLTTRVHRNLVHKGFIVGRRPGVNVLRLDPPLTIERADIEGFLRALEAVLLECGAGGQPLTR
jgi:acetylornithine aminotransferase